MNTRSDESQLELLLEFLRETRGLDFTGYKRPSLSRRIRKRMDAVDVDEFDEYRDYLELHPEEQPRLVDTILINVTSFFRDEAAWKFLADDVVPAIVCAKGPDDPIRVWSAGCASGEEAYSLAMVFADHLGVDEFKARVKIFATDTDEGALVRARSGTYTERQMEPVPSDARDRYFTATPTGYAFRTDCRRSVIFGRNDITADAPISRLDLLTCRNVLMYFVGETQRRVLNRFHYALADGGSLVLGKAETILAHSERFETVSTPLRVFARNPGITLREDILSVRGSDAPRRGVGSSVLESLASSASPVAQIVIDVDGLLVSANPRARAMFGLTVGDLAHPFWDLDVSRNPVDLRAHVKQAYTQGQLLVLRDVVRAFADGQRQFLEVSIAPLRDPAGADLGASLTFTDVSELGRMRTQLEHSARQLEAANRDLVSVNEELETSNEELQSTNEELETTNEELQSANEELETMNEELQSANEELETMNEELIGQSGQIEQGERFLADILDSLVVGVAVVNPSLDVIVWNRAAENLFGVRTEEATGRSFLALDIGLPVGEIGPLLHAALGADTGDTGDTAQLLLDAVNRRGHSFVCRVSVERLPHRTGPDVDVVVLMDPLPEVPT